MDDNLEMFCFIQQTWTEHLKGLRMIKAIASSNKNKMEISCISRINISVNYYKKHEIILKLLHI